MKRALVADAADNVGVVLESIKKGDVVSFSDSGRIEAVNDIAMPHKIALVPIKEGDPVRKYGGVIGYAVRNISPGEWVHSHNIESGTGERGADK